jgi:hypothetical protein
MSALYRLAKNPGGWWDVFIFHAGHWRLSGQAMGSKADAEALAKKLTAAVPA